MPRPIAAVARRPGALTPRPPASRPPFVPPAPMGRRRPPPRPRPAPAGAAHRRRRTSPAASSPGWRHGVGVGASACCCAAGAAAAAATLMLAVWRALHRVSPPQLGAHARWSPAPGLSRRRRRPPRPTPRSAIRWRRPGPPWPSLTSRTADETVAKTKILIPVVRRSVAGQNSIWSRRSTLRPARLRKPAKACPPAWSRSPTRPAGRSACSCASCRRWKRRPRTGF